MVGVAIAINADAGAPAYGSDAWRQAMAVDLMYDGRAVGARQGVRPGGTQLQVTLAGSTITVAPGVAVLDPALTTTHGPYRVAIPVAETHTLDPADAVNPRKDIVILRVYDDDMDNSGQRKAQTEYLAGIPGPVPAEQAVPSGAMRLATIDVPQVGGGSPVVTDRRVWTVAAGGILPVPDGSAVTGATAGMYRDNGLIPALERFAGSGWEKVADPKVFTPWTPYTPVWTASGTAPSIGNGVLSGAYMQVGKTVHVRGKLVIGSLSTLGTGSWRFSIPFAAVSFHPVGSLFLFDSGGTVRGGITALIDPTTLWPIYSAGGDITPTNPHAWAAGDELHWSVTYEQV